MTELPLTSDFAIALTDVFDRICQRKFKVDQIQTEHSIELVYTFSMADIRLVTGRNGRQANAIQYLAQHASRRTGGKAILVRLIENYEGNRVLKAAPEPDPWFTPARAVLAVEPMCQAVLGYMPSYVASLSGNTIHLLLRAREDDDAVAIVALGDLFWPYGKSYGVNLKIRLHE